MTVNSSAGAKPSRGRYIILALIAFATMLNYLDRTLISVAAPVMTKELAIDPVMMGLVMSAFSWTYAMAQIPGGVVLDRFGTRITYTASLVLWSIFTAAQGLAVNIATLIGARLAMGAAEAPCFPANSRVLVGWFPQRERARANSVYSVGMYFGIAFLSPVLFWVTATFGWRVLFIAAGLIGVVFGLVFWKVYREPHESKLANQGELDEIAQGGGIKMDVEKTPFNWADVGWLLKQRQVIGASLGQFATNSTLIFFLTWFPTYLVTERGMDFIKVGFLASLPFIAASIGVLVGGQLSDGILKKTGSLNWGRKTPVVAGLLLSSLITVAAFVDSNAIVILVMSIAFFGQGMSNLGWTLISEVAPQRLIGMTGGVFNFCTNLAGIITPILIGIVVAQTGSFFGGLAFIGGVALIGALSYIFILGDVKRIEEPVR
jgi:ACS family D-galactonate transporter-like MFS transporter